MIFGSVALAVALLRRRK
ncbi:MAG: hypothetical protein E7035_07295 [Verrucomicrobiaceae bacterium]|nr:hypothetical protein [Verrucomicrobiaceae bacterium]